MRKEEGATVAATPTFSQRAASLFRRAGRAAFHGNLQTFSGKAPLTTTNVPTTKRRRFSDKSLDKSFHQNR